MAHLILPHKWSRQPQGPVRPSSSLSSRITFLSLPGQRRPELVSGKFPTLTGSTRMISAHGQALRRSASPLSGDVLVYTGAPAITSAPYTVVVLANPSAEAKRSYFFHQGSDAPSGYPQIQFCANTNYQANASSGLIALAEYDGGYKASADAAGQIDGNWHVFAVVRPAGTVTPRLYRDGAQLTIANSSTNAAIPAVSTAPGEVGGGSAGDYSPSGDIAAVVVLAGEFDDIPASPGEFWATFLEPLPRRLYVPSAGVGTSAVSRDADLRWSVLQAISRDADLRWSLLSSIAADATLAWSLLTAAARDADLRYSILQAAQADTDLRFDLLAAAARDLDARWDVASALSAVSRDASIVWDLYAAASRDLTAQWALLAAVERDADLRWALLAAISRDATLTYHILAAALRDADLRWDVLSSLSAVTRDIDLRWSALAAVVASLQTQWDLLAAVGVDAELRWHIAQTVARELDARWDLRSAAARDLTGQWSIVAASERGVQLVWSVQSDTPQAGLAPIHVFVVPREARAYVLPAEQLSYH